MKLKINRVIVNLFLLLVASALLWYVIQSQNVLSQKSSNFSSTSQETEIQFTDKNYFLSYKNFDPMLVENIGIFGSLEKWLGSGYYDSDVFFEYPRSLSLVGGNKEVVTAVKDVKFNLAKAINFDLMLNFRSNPDDLEIGSLNFVDVNGNTASFVLPRMENGWKALSIPKEQVVTPPGFNWTDIIKVKLEFVSRPYAKVVVNLDSLRVEPGTILYNDWNAIDNQMLILDKRGGEISLLGRNIAGSVATIKKITSAQNFTFQGSYAPLTDSGASGLFFRGNYKTGKGYYLLFSGVNGNNWQIIKNGKNGVKVLVTGEISNFRFKYENKYFLKVEVKGNSIKGYFSTDGVNFTKLAEVFDEEFVSGGVGVATTNGAIALFNDFMFNQ